jgi:hypothetical protein
MSISLQNSISLDNFNSTFHKAKKCSEIGPEKASHQKMEDMTGRKVDQKDKGER